MALKAVQEDLVRASLFFCCMLAQLYAGHGAGPASGSASGTCFIPRGHDTLILNGAAIFEDGRFGPLRVFSACAGLSLRGLTRGADDLHHIAVLIRVHKLISFSKVFRSSGGVDFQCLKTSVLAALLAGSKLRWDFALYIT